MQYATVEPVLELHADPGKTLLGPGAECVCIIAERYVQGTTLGIESTGILTYCHVVQILVEGGVIAAFLEKGQDVVPSIALITDFIRPPLH